MKQKLTDYQARLLLKVGIVVFAVIVMGTALIIEHSHMTTAINTNHIETTRESDASDRYQNHKNHVKAVVLKNADSNADPIIKAIGNNQNTINDNKPVLDTFFKVYYNWNSNKSYEARPKKLQGIADNSLLKNKKWFDKGKDSTGGNYIDNLQLNSVLNNLTIGILSQSKATDTFMVDAEYTAWHGDTNNKAQGSHWFKVTVNNKTHRITDMSTMYDNPKESTTQDTENQ